MATRKIRLTLNGTQLDGTGPIVDIDFNSVNLDADLEITSQTVKEYTVDVAAGTYNLDLSYKNDAKSGDADRNLVVEKIEYANDGINYQPYFATESSSNLTRWKHFTELGYRIRIDLDDPDAIAELNPDYDPSQPRTDGEDYDFMRDPGPNNKRLYDVFYGPITIFTSSTATLNITFE